MKTIIECLSTIAKRKDCDACGNTGIVGWDDNCPDCNQLGEPCHCNRPCPTCADLRKVAEMCWHEPLRGPYGPCKHCNIKPGPSDSLNTINYVPTIPELRSMLEIVGVWDRFIITVWNNQLKPASQRTGKLMKLACNFADILTSDKFYAVAEEFLKGEVEG